MVVALLGVGCAGPGPVPLAQPNAAGPAPSKVAPSSTPLATKPPSPEASFEVTVVPDRAPALDVSCRLPLDWVDADTTTVRITFGEEHFGKGPTSYDYFVRAIAADGSEKPWQTDYPGHPSVLELRYRVRLEHAEAEPEFGRDEAPHATSTGWFLTGRAFIPLVSIVLPSGQTKQVDLGSRLRLSSPYPDVHGSAVPTDERGVFTGPGLAGLRDAMYVVGKTNAITLDEASHTPVTLVTSDFGEEGLRPTAALVRRTLDLARARLGEPAPGRRVIFLDRDRERGGGVIGDGIAVLAPQPPDATTTSGAAQVLVHELLHLWNRADAHWLNEGFVRYLEVLLTHQLDQASPEALARALVVQGQQYLRTAHKGSIAQSKGVEAYPAGAMVALCLDGLLREQQQSLWAIHAEVRTDTAEERPRLAAERLLAALERRTPAAAAAARAWLAQTGPIDLAPCYRRMGIEVEQQAYEGLTERAFALEVLVATSFNPEATTIFAVGPGSLFERRDEIVAAQGKPLTRLGDLEWLVSGLKAGQSVMLDVRRGGALKHIRLVVPKLSADARERHGRLVLKRPVASP